MTKNGFGLVNYGNSASSYLFPFLWLPFPLSTPFFSWFLTSHLLPSMISSLLSLHSSSSKTHHVVSSHLLPFLPPPFLVSSSPLLPSPLSLSSPLLSSTSKQSMVMSGTVEKALCFCLSVGQEASWPRQPSHRWDLYILILSALLFKGEKTGRKKKEKQGQTKLINTETEIKGLRV